LFVGGSFAGKKVAGFVLNNGCYDDGGHGPRLAR